MQQSSKACYEHPLGMTNRQLHTSVPYCCKGVSRNINVHFVQTLWLVRVVLQSHNRMQPQQSLCTYCKQDKMFELRMKLYPTNVPFFPPSYSPSHPHSLFHLCTIQSFTHFTYLSDSQDSVFFSLVSLKAQDIVVGQTWPNDVQLIHSQQYLHSSVSCQSSCVLISVVNC